MQPNELDPTVTPRADQVRKSARVWLVVQGILGVIIGLLFLFLPFDSVFVLAIFFGVWLLLGGILGIVSYFMQDKQLRSGWSLAAAIVSLIGGLIAVISPGVAAFALAFIIAGWALVLGIVSIVGSFQLRRRGTQFWWALLIAGILGVLLGLFMFIWPGAGLLSIVWVIGIYAIVDGVAQIALAVRLRKPQNPAEVPSS